MNKSTFITVVIGFVARELKMTQEELIRRTSNPEKYYSTESDWKAFQESFENADRKLDGLCNERKRSLVYKRDRDYIFDFYNCRDGIYCCMYRLIEIEPS